MSNTNLQLKILSADRYDVAGVSLYARLGIQGEVAVRLKHIVVVLVVAAAVVIVMQLPSGVLAVYYCFYFYIYFIYPCSLFSWDYCPINLGLPLWKQKHLNTCRSIQGQCKYKHNTHRFRVITFTVRKPEVLLVLSVYL